MMNDDTIGKRLDTVNETLIAEMVTAGKMPVEVLDHLGHVKHGIYSFACPYCTKPAGS